MPYRTTELKGRNLGENLAIPDKSPHHRRHSAQEEPCAAYSSSSFCFSIASQPPQPTRPPAAPSGSGSPVLQRIFANWKARRERITSLHFVWDMRLTIPKGRRDGAEPENTVVPADRHKDEHGNELWIAGDDHVCAEFREWPSQPHAKSADKQGIVGRQAFNGQLESRFWVSQSEKLHFVPEGWMHPAKEQSRLRLPSIHAHPVDLPDASSVDALARRRLPADYRVNAIIDGVRYISSSKRQ